MQVYLDDERATPDGWMRVYWPDQAIALLETGEVARISLDHDLGDDARGTGYDVIVWIEHAVVMHGFSSAADGGAFGQSGRARAHAGRDRSDRTGLGRARAMTAWNQRAH